MNMGMRLTTPDTEQRTSSDMHDAGREDVVRQKHRCASYTEAVLEHHYNGCDSVGSLDTEVIILLGEDSEFWVIGTIRSSVGHYQTVYETY